MACQRADMLQCSPWVPARLPEARKRPAQFASSIQVRKGAADRGAAGDDRSPRQLAEKTVERVLQTAWRVQLNLQ